VVDARQVLTEELTRWQRKPKSRLRWMLERAQVRCTQAELEHAQARKALLEWSP
jgi:hypothetical protein